MMRHLLGGARHLAVIDVETTGLSARDQVIELAVLLLDEDGREIEAWESLFRPTVPLTEGAARVNGLRMPQLEGAPSFGDLAASVAELLDGACLVAHNARFDLGMLGRAFGSIGSRLEAPRVVDTYTHTRSRLLEALERHRIPAVDLHQAMGDVRATAELLRRTADAAVPGGPATVAPRPPVSGAAPLPRAATSGVSPARRRRSEARPPTVSGSDRRAPGERVPMRSVATGRPGGATVDMDDPSLLHAQEPLEVAVALENGMHVVITTLVDHAQDAVTRHATSIGLVVKPEVTRQTRLIITDDVDSPSRRARKARQLGVPFARCIDILRASSGDAVTALVDAARRGPL